jgi:hypothetical protein
MPLDAVTVNALLDVALKSAQAANLRAINESAANELAQINAELEAELRPPPEEPVEVPPVEGDV